MEVHAGRVRQWEDRFAVRLQALKDKRSGTGWGYEEVVHGAPGVR